MITVGTWLKRKNIAYKGDLEQINLRWRYECSKCGYLSQHRTDYCKACKSKMYYLNE